MGAIFIEGAAIASSGGFAWIGIAIRACRCGGRGKPRPSRLTAQHAGRRRTRFAEPGSYKGVVEDIEIGQARWSSARRIVRIKPAGEQK